jgi:hypothetical protein
LHKFHDFEGHHQRDGHDVDDHEEPGAKLDEKVHEGTEIVGSTQLKIGVKIAIVDLLPHCVEDGADEGDGKLDTDDKDDIGVGRELKLGELGTRTN